MKNMTGTIGRAICCSNMPYGKIRRGTDKKESNHCLNVLLKWMNAGAKRW